MLGILGDMAEAVGKVIGTVCGIPIATLAITLGVSETVIREAVAAGCETVDEIRDFISNT